MIFIYNSILCFTFITFVLDLLDVPRMFQSFWLPIQYRSTKINTVDGKYIIGHYIFMSFLVSMKCFEHYVFAYDLWNLITINFFQKS